MTNSDTHSFDSSIELEGEFDAAGAEPPKVLPASFDISDFRLRGSLNHVIFNPNRAVGKGGGRRIGKHRKTKNI